MKTKKNEKIYLRVVAVYDKQKGQYVKSVPLEMDLDVLDKLFKPYTEDPLTYGYEITPKMAALLEKYIEFDFKRFKYTMEASVTRVISVYDKKSEEYLKGIPLKIDLDILNQLYKQYEDDPLFYGCYEVNPLLLEELKKYIVGDNDNNFDFNRFIYIVEAYAME